MPDPEAAVWPGRISDFEVDAGDRILCLDIVHNTNPETAVDAILTAAGEPAPGEPGRPATALALAFRDDPDRAARIETWACEFSLPDAVRTGDAARPSMPRGGIRARAED